jgi:hypothetical protein
VTGLTITSNFSVNFAASTNNMLFLGHSYGYTNPMDVEVYSTITTEYITTILIESPQNLQDICGMTVNSDASKLYILGNIGVNDTSSVATLFTIDVSHPTNIQFTPMRIVEKWDCSQIAWIDESHIAMKRDAVLSIFRL